MLSNSATVKVDAEYTLHPVLSQEQGGGGVLLAPSKLGITSQINPLTFWESCNVSGRMIKAY